jgi:tetratricopeptide (TPR) repeat protein
MTSEAQEASIVADSAPSQIAEQANIAHLVQLFQSGHYHELENEARHLLAGQPQCGFYWKVLGVALQMRGTDALAALQTASQLLPHDAEAASNLGNALRDLGQLPAAEQQYRHALSLQPDSALTHNNLGNVLRSQVRPAEAIASFRQALRINPHYAEAYFNLGTTQHELKLPDEAIASYRAAIAIRADFEAAHNNLGIALCEQGLYADAAASLQRALSLNPQYAEAYYNLGNVLYEQARFAEAAQQYQLALALHPAYAQAHNNLGNALREFGQLDEARQAYENAIAIEPDRIDSHYSLSLLNTGKSDLRYLPALERHLPNAETLPLDTRVRLWFTLGKLYEDAERYDESFHAYEKGNVLQRSQLQWDEATQAALTERITATFDADFFSHQSECISTEFSPIFIVGMPRSGTSLIEQILSTFPGVYGAGELTELSAVITSAMPEARFDQFPEAVLNLSNDQLAALGKQYTKRLRNHAPSALYIVDKMPENFFYIGMIRAMLPNAKIIHAMRDPMDSCFSCYARLFANASLPFSYDLQTVGRYYNRYANLMQHWHRVLPKGAFLDMRYEDLITDTETQVHRLCAYLGLQWDEGCLAFYDNERQVKTASMAQVRQPIYQTSVARWEHYADHLKPLYALVHEHRH